jgi:hypothetical protein
MASMASASVDAMSRRSAALCSLPGPCPVCPPAVDHRAPSYLQTAASARMGCRKCVRVYLFGPPKHPTAPSSVRGLVDQGSKTQRRHESLNSERARHRRHRFTPDHAGRVSGPYPSSRPIAGAITNAAPATRVVDKAQAPQRRCFEGKSRGPIAPNRVRSVTRRYSSFENGHGPVLEPGIGRIGGLADPAPATRFPFDKNVQCQ